MLKIITFDTALNKYLYYVKRNNKEMFKKRLGFLRL